MTVTGKVQKFKMREQMEKELGLGLKQLQSESSQRKLC